MSFFRFMAVKKLAAFLVPQKGKMKGDFRIKVNKNLWKPLFVLKAKTGKNVSTLTEEALQQMYLKEVPNETKT